MDKGHDRGIKWCYCRKRELENVYRPHVLIWVDQYLNISADCVSTVEFPPGYICALLPGSILPHCSRVVNSFAAACQTAVKYWLCLLCSPSNRPGPKTTVRPGVTQHYTQLHLGNSVQNSLLLRCFLYGEIVEPRKAIGVTRGKLMTDYGIEFAPPRPQWPHRLNKLGL